MSRLRRDTATPAQMSMAQHATRRFGALARWSVPALYLAGILATFAREIVLAATYGTGAIVESFRLAFAVPNLLSTSLGPAFVAAVTPVLMRAEGDPSRHAAAVREIAAVNVAGVLLLSAVAVATAPLQAKLLAPGYGPQASADLSGQVAWMWLFFVFAGCSFSLRAFLGERGILWPAAGATVLSAGAIALGCALAGPVLPERMREWPEYLTLLSVLGGMLILATHVIASPRGTIPALSIRLADIRGVVLDPRGIGASIALVTVHHVLSAVPRLIDRSVATTIEAGTVAALEYSFSLITVPGILLGTSLVTMLYPGLSRAIESGASLPRRDLARPVTAALLLSAIAGAVMSLGAPWIIELVFARGSFDSHSVATTAAFLRWHGVALPFMVVTIILAQAALAFRDFRLVLSVAVARILVKWVAVYLLVPQYGLHGLAASFVVPEAVSALALWSALRVRLRSVTMAPGSL